MTESVLPIKSANLSSMEKYKSLAKLSHDAKIKSFAGGGQVTDFPIRAPVVSSLPTGYPSVLKAARLATSRSVTTATHGKAAELKIAQMEREASKTRRGAKKD